MKNFDSVESDWDWSIYAAFAPAKYGTVYVKVGRSTQVIHRITGLITGCPFKIETTLHSAVGGLSRARRMEDAIHQELRPFSTRGEWFEFDIEDPSHKDAFHTATKRVYSRFLRREPMWKVISWEQVKAYMQAHRDKQCRGRYSHTIVRVG